MQAHEVFFDNNVISAVNHRPEALVYAAVEFVKNARSADAGPYFAAVMPTLTHDPMHIIESLEVLLRTD